MILVAVDVLLNSPDSDDAGAALPTLDIGKSSPRQDGYGLPELPPSLDRCRQGIAHAALGAKVEILLRPLAVSPNEYPEPRAFFAEFFPVKSGKS